MLTRGFFFACFAPSDQPRLISDARASEPLPDFMERILEQLIENELDQETATVLKLVTAEFPGMPLRALAETMGMSVFDLRGIFEEARRRMAARFSDVLLHTPARRRGELLLLIAETSPVVAQRALDDLAGGWIRSKADLLPFLESEIRDVRELGQALLGRLARDGYADAAADTHTRKKR